MCNIFGIILHQDEKEALNHAHFYMKSYNLKQERLDICDNLVVNKKF